ncbi:hypothetical protein RUM44_008802 [Polyplax serrata]|uniref:SH3 domain-containing protein n=1 Tax=Polyplax serrata TaxID=468196 RepID=A0ABR1B9A3_POLSC
MGQKPSSLWSKPKISLTWALKNDIPIISSNGNGKTSSHDNRNKTLLKTNNLRKNSNFHCKQNDLNGRQKTTTAVSGRTLEPKKESGTERRYEEKRSVSPTSSTSTARLGRRRRLRRARPRCTKSTSSFGYEIQDVDEFLTKASLESPGNIPMVLSRPCVLYETHTEGTQREGNVVASGGNNTFSFGHLTGRASQQGLTTSAGAYQHSEKGGKSQNYQVSLPLGMVVNGVLKNRAWLYAQTPHGEEGYVPYACCLPLGILPAPSRPQPCWDTQTDIFPRPSGNRTDREKLRDETRSECGARTNANRKRTPRDSGERSVDGLYLRASRKPTTRQTLLVIGADYKSPDTNKLTVCKGDVVSLVSSHLKDWFWVRDRNGMEGFIPAESENISCTAEKSRDLLMKFDGEDSKSLLYGFGAPIGSVRLEQVGTVPKPKKARDTLGYLKSFDM